MTTDKTKTFIKKARKVHGGRYGYDEVVYKGNKSKVIIVCHQHGVFEQTASDHLSGYGCPECGIGSRAKKRRLYSKENFTKKARKVHGGRYGYDEVVYKSSNSKVRIICHEHGVFEQTPNHHLGGEGCRQCGEEYGTNGRSNNETFIKKAREVHDDWYDYDEVIYKNSRSKVTIVCPIHGAFEQAPTPHLSGRGCEECGQVGPYNAKTALRGDHDGKEITLYWVTLTNKKTDEHFHKIGLTSSTLRDRRPGSPLYSWTKVQTIEGIDATSAILFEQYLHNDCPFFKEKSYIPTVEFNGHTECYHSLDDWDMASAFDEFCQSRHKGNIQLTFDLM